MNAQRVLHRINHKVVSLFNKEDDFVIHNGVVLPAAHLRCCTEEFKKDPFFLDSCKEETRRLVTQLGLNKDTHLLEIGCGPGRLAIGILKYFGEIKFYEGIDIDKAAIRWCRKHITSRSPSFHFDIVDAKHDRYNPRGKEMNQAFHLPFKDEMFDIIYLHSVFSNMVEKDIRIYAKEFRRLIKPAGMAFMTAFVEDNVPSVTYNPENYVMPCKGSLHIARYEKNHFLTILRESGFEVQRFDYGMELGGQSAFYLRPEQSGSRGRE